MAFSGLRSLTGHIPTGQFGRYLLVGGANTAFAYGTYALFTFVLAPFLPASYLLGSLLSSLLTVTVSYLAYKRLVFKTRGNYLREWTRCLVVYSGSIALGLVLLHPMVFVVDYVIGNERAAPYIAGAILLVAQVVISFIGHRRFSFTMAPDRECERNADIPDAG